MKVLVTGGAGYIGSTLVQLLLDRGYEVTCLDRLFFGREGLKSVMNNPKFRVIREDIRWFNPKILEGVDVVVDLAALSNDPAGELDPQKTLEINYKGRVRVARLAKEKGVERYILASSCSVYGFQEGLLNESSPTDPLTTYAKANLLAEREILPLADENFTPLALRQATVYGLSPRMRFDLAINGMTLGFFKKGKIPILRDGNQWRPFVHVRDTSKAFILAMEAPKEEVSGEVFNVGANEQNYQIFPLAKLVAESIGLPFEYEWYGSPDYRSYRVSFDKIKEVLKFKPELTPREGAREVYEALQEGTVTDDLKTITVKWYKHLLEMQKFLKEVEIGGVIL
ncbi:MAG: SDR family oxidoreductase [Candidatus Jordarchaeaceae archaeon]